MNGPVRPKQKSDLAGGFLFLYFLFLFFTKIYFRFEILQKYTPAAPLPGGRDLAARQPGGRGLSAKKDDKKLQTGPWGPVARHWDGRPPTVYKVLAAPHPLICLTKNPEKKEKRVREGEAKRRSPTRFSSRRLQVTKILYIL